MLRKRKASNDLSPDTSTTTDYAAPLENRANGEFGAREQRKTSTDHPLTTHLSLADQPQRNLATRTLDPKAYTVGWVTALPLELAASIAVLDEGHEQPYSFEKASTDRNNYTWGRIGEHNVVIASLPAGVYGTISAATTASSMLSSFPQIRVGLMVGIGAGVARPEEPGRDIRLGDIVVSQPVGQSGGVIQYDLGKAKTEGRFERIGSLNMPPEALLKALAKLQAQHELEPSKVPEILEEMLRNNPHMAKPKQGKPGYVFQGEENDRLFEASYKHTKGLDCRKCDSQQEIVRDPRDSKDPEIHYGAIASGNQLIKDGLIRDSIIREIGEDCICFEMEAAGLMNSFPCLVIRGICDYADSHKNDRWQRYAAATAAAYAKEFLGIVPGEDLKKTRNAIDILEDVSKFTARISDAVEESKCIIDKLDHDSHQREVVKWLSAPDPSINHNKALRKRHKGSGSWFLQSKAFAEWKTCSNSSLWLHGIPGCGKTILSSIIIENLSETIPSSHTLLYFYFDFSDIEKQSFENMLRSLISQLYYRLEKAREEVDLLFSSYGKLRQPTTGLLCDLFLRSVMQADRALIILDALDECKTRKGNETEGLLSWIRHFQKLRLNNVHLLVTSRPEQDIRTILEAQIGKESIISLQSNLVAQDIYDYIHTNVREYEGFKRWRGRPEVQVEIENQLAEKANGMFRWVACQLDVLETCTDLRMLREALASLPETLDETYARILDSISSNHKRNMIRILQFLAYSERPLFLEEAVDAIAVDLEASPGFTPEYRMPNPEEITSSCPSLAIMVSLRDKYAGQEIKEIRLAHFSVKEYLTSSRVRRDLSRFFKETTARTSITHVCLTYLIHLDQEYPLEKIKRAFPFAWYSARYWFDHAMAGEENEILRGLIKNFSLWREGSFDICCELYQPWKRLGYSLQPNKPSPLCYASLVGFYFAAQVLLEEGADPNAGDRFYDGALKVASAGGHEQIVKLLLDNGANANAQGGPYGSALQVASNRGYEQIVKLLLNNGANINAQGGLYGDALQEASDEGHEQIVKLLLDNGANINAQGGPYGSALQVASNRGHEQIVKLLLNNGANINAQGGLYGSALQVASDKGYGRIVKLLLDKGAER